VLACLWPMLGVAVEAAEPAELAEPADPAETSESAEAAEPDSEESAAPSAAAVILLDPDQHDLLPSALDQMDPSKPPVDEDAPKAAVWRGSTWVKPTLAMWFAAVDGERHAPVELGLAAGRRWFPVVDAPMWGTEVSVRGAAPLAQSAGGYALTVSAGTGPWIEFVGLQVGPELSLLRRKFGDAAIPAAVVASARASLSFDLRMVQLYGGVAPGWTLWGGEEAPDVAFGDQLALFGGVGVTLGWVRLSGDLERVDTALGPLTRVGLGLRVRPPG
jgi:hypothetical protein